MIKVFVEQPLGLPGSANYFPSSCIKHWTKSTKKSGLRKTLNLLTDADKSNDILFIIFLVQFKCCGSAIEVPLKCFWSANSQQSPPQTFLTISEKKAHTFFVENFDIPSQYYKTRRLHDTRKWVFRNDVDSQMANQKDTATLWLNQPRGPIQWEKVSFSSRSRLCLYDKDSVKLRIPAFHHKFDGESISLKLGKNNFYILWGYSEQ